MAELKTKENNGNVVEFLNSVENEKRRKDSFQVLDIMTKITGEEPRMWGDSIVGFGRYHYKYASGREGDWMIIGFSPRKASLTLYIMNGFKRYDELLTDLGKCKTAKSCLYIKSLEDISIEVLEEMIEHSYNYMNDKYNS